MQPLPIDDVVPEICGVLRSGTSLVLEAPPGAGKTTRIPYALCEALPADAGEIVVSEPRRLAARLAARRVAGEREAQLGGTVGYTVRFEDVSSRETRVRYVTDGVLLRMLVERPELPGVAAVLLDEFHERHMASDVALAMLRRRRPDLRLVVMSATLDAEPLARFLDAPRLRSEGRRFEVSIEHLERDDDRPLKSQIVSAVRRVMHEEPDGHVLVFVPGAREIREVCSALERIASESNVLVLPLHGDLPIEQQQRAVDPAPQRKIVVSTNVAESSITVEGVTAVIDSGLARIASFSPYTGLPRLVTTKISRASAAQRAGRAGRTRPGRVIRLYTRADHDLRPEQDAPEIARADLAEVLLALRGAGIASLKDLEWLSPPPERACAAAEQLLRSLGAVESDGKLTTLGRRIGELPVHPRLGRLLLAGARLGVAERAATAAALLGERDLRSPARVRMLGGAGSPSRFDSSSSSDILELIELFERARLLRFDPRALRELELDAGVARAVDRGRRQLRRAVRAREGELDAASADEAMERALLAAFPDRVARRRSAGRPELVLSSGETARLAESSVVHDAPLLIALDIEERDLGRGKAISVRLASAIKPEWLLDDHPDLLESKETLFYNPETARVERLSRISCGSVVLEESRSAAPPSAEASRLLAREVLASPESLGELERLGARIALLSAEFPALAPPAPADDALAELVARSCEGAVAIRDLGPHSVAERIVAALPPRQAHLLAEETPERIALPGGRSVRVAYELGKPPYIASRLQDFFGMKETPRICRGRVALTVHLLAPNQRAVQVTNDLAGFWTKHYPYIRRELMRRYPKHAWPEDGENARPPQPKAPLRR